MISRKKHVARSGALSRASGRESGNVLIEFGLVLVATLALVFLVLNVAWAVFARSVLQEAVREGVRFGVVGNALSGYSGLNASIQQVVKQYSYGFINSSNLSNVTVTYYSPTTLAQVTGSTATTNGNIISVAATAISVRPLVPILQTNGTFKMTALSLGATATDVMEVNSSASAP